MKRYPRSFLQLVTFGHLLVMLPLLLAGIYVFTALDTLNTHYRAAIEEVSTSSRLSGELSEDLVHMERDLRRHEILRDTPSLQDYAQVRGQWQNDVAAFTRLPPLPPGIIKELQAQLAQEEAAFTTLRTSGDPQPLHAAIAEIKLSSAKTLDDAHVILEREQEKYLGESTALRARMLLAAGAAGLIALFFLWLIRKLLARLIGRFEHAVLRLGKGELQQEIALDGPGDLRWLGRWLEWLRRRLLSLEESRTLVLRHVSHELKTPLAAMNEGASLLAEQIAGPLTEEQGRIVKILQSNSHRLQDLIEGLLRLQQAEHAAERIGHEKLRFDKLIEQVLDTHRLIAGERKICIQCSLQETPIVAGREAMVTIIHNLLSNAVKFSPAGGQVQVMLQHDLDRATLDVLDQGPGIDADDMTKIFEPFYRGKASRQMAGAGLGLTITREFVLAHRGELLLVPAAQGAHFRVVLPCRAAYLRSQPDA